MNLIRPYLDSDQKAIDCMQKAQGFDYEKPDWSRMLVSGVFETDGEPRMAAFLRKTAEVFLLFDPGDGTRKRERIGQFLALHRELIEPAKQAGFDDVHCWLPPAIDERFGTVLQHLEWAKQLWPCYNRQLR